MARIKKTTKSRSHESKNIDDHILGETQFVELGAQNSPVENIKYDVKQGEVHSDPMEENGTGPKAVVRRFRFRLPPGLPMTPSNEELLDWHKKHTVIPMLWKDELELIDEPRIIAGKKGAFTIVAICHPRTVLGVRSMIHEKADLIQNVINNAGSN